MKAEYAAQTLQGKKRLDLRHENKKLFYLYLYLLEVEQLCTRPIPSLLKRVIPKSTVYAVRLYRLVRKLCNLRLQIDSVWFAVCTCYHSLPSSPFHAKKLFAMISLRRCKSLFAHFVLGQSGLGISRLGNYGKLKNNGKFFDANNLIYRSLPFFRL